MSSEINDYFGGNSSRKFEPIEDDELLELDDPVETEPEPSHDDDTGCQPELNADEAQAEVFDIAQPDCAADLKEGEREQDEDDSESDSVELPTIEQADEPAVAETSASENVDPWALLASDLGIQPTVAAKKPPVSEDQAEESRPAKAKKKKAGGTKSRRSAESGAKSPAPESSAGGGFAAGLFEDKPSPIVEEAVAEVETPQQPELESSPTRRQQEPDSRAAKADERDEPESEKPVEDFFGIGLFDEDQSAQPSKEILSEMFVPSGESFETPEVDEDLSASADEFRNEVVVEDVSESFDDDMIEFEVTELGGDDKGPRRARRRRRGRAEREPAETHSPPEEPESGRREKRRRGEVRDDERRPKKSRKTRAVQEEAELVESPVEAEARREKPGRRRKRRRDTEFEEERSDDVERREEKSRDSRKRPSIPTWDDAIGGVIEKNIQLRAKSSNSGKRRKRKR